MTRHQLLEAIEFADVLVREAERAVLDAQNALWQAEDDHSEAVRELEAAHRELALFDAGLVDGDE